MENGFAIFGAYSIEMELVNMPLREGVQFDADGFVILCDFDGLDFWEDIVDLGAAVFFLVDVREFAGCVALRIACADRIDGLGEGELEAVRFCVHLMNFEGNFAGPLDSFESKRMSAFGSPPAVGSSDEELSIGSHAGSDWAGFETFKEREYDALFDSVDGFQINAGHIGVALVRNEYLFLKGAKLSFTLVADDCGGRISDLPRAIDHVNSGRHQFLDLGSFGDHAALIHGVLRPRAHVGGELVPFVASWMSLERAGNQVLKRACPMPRALVVRVVNFAVCIEPDSSWGAHAAASGNHRAVRLHTQRPTAERSFARERTG